MNHWKHKVDVSDVFHNDDLTLSEKAQTLARRLARFTDEYDTTLDELLDELRDAGHEGDARWFDDVWSGIYDWADEERVWIDTHRRADATAAAGTENDERGVA